MSPHSAFRISHSSLNSDASIVFVNRITLFAAPWMIPLLGLLGRPVFVPLPALFIAMLTWTVLRFRLIPPRALPILAGIHHWTLVSFWALVGGCLLRIIEPAWPFLLLLPYPILRLLARSPRGRRASMIIAWLLMMVLAWEPVFILASTALFFLYFREARSSDAFADLHPRTLALAWSLGILFARIFGFYFGTYPLDRGGDADRDSTRLISLTLERAPKNWMGKTLFAMESCDPDWLVFGMESSRRLGVGVLHRPTGQIVPLPGVSTTIIQAPLDCNSNRLYVGDVEAAHIAVFPARPPWPDRPIQVFPAGRPPLENVLLDIERNRLLVVDEKGGLTLLDAQSGNRLAFKAWKMARYLADSRSPYLASFAGRVDVLFEELGKFETLVSTQVIREGWLPPFETPILAARDIGLLLMTSMPLGLLYFIDLSTLKVIDTLALEPGIRFMALHPTRPVVLVGGYGRGHLFAVDLIEKQILAKFRIGPGIRTITVSREGDKAYVLSTRGIVEVDLRPALDARESR